MTDADGRNCVILTQQQRKALLERLDRIRFEEGRFGFTLDFEDLSITAIGEIELDGYCEDDYYNGTGGWVETYRRARVVISAFDELGRYHPVDRRTKEEADNLLNQT